MRLAFRLFLLGLILAGCSNLPSMSAPTPTIYKPIISTATILATPTATSTPTVISTPTTSTKSPEIKVNFGRVDYGGIYYTELEGFKEHVNALIWLDDGKTLVIASQQNYLVYFDTQSNKTTINPLGDLWVSSFAISPDKKILAMISAFPIAEEISVRFVNLETGKEISTIRVKKETVFLFNGTTQLVYRGAGTFAPDGKTFILNSGKQITLWDVKSGKQIKELFKCEPNFLVSNIFLNPAKNSLFASSYDINDVQHKKTRFLRWDTNSWRLTATFTGDFYGFSFSPDGDTFTPLGTANINSGTVAELFKFTGSRNLGLYRGDIAYDPNENYIAVSNLQVTSIYYASTGDWYRSLLGFTAEVSEFSPDGTKLAVGGGFERPGVVRIWDLNQP